jgi:hypothetical protein
MNHFYLPERPAATKSATPKSTALASAVRTGYASARKPLRSPRLTPRRATCSSISTSDSSQVTAWWRMRLSWKAYQPSWTLGYVSMIDSVAEAVEEGADGVVPVTEAEQEAAAEVPALPLGTSSPLGNEYNVTINSVNLDAAADILAMNEFNEDASGQYVLVDVTAEYTGSEEGDPWIDLSVNFVGSDARQYDSSTCTASLETGAFDVPTLENGGTADYQLCMDVPAGAVDGGKLFVEPTISFDNDSRTYWAVQ